MTIKLKRALCSLCAVSLAAIAWCADGTGSLSEWVNEMPATIDGVAVYRPVEESGKLQISDMIDFPNTSQQTIFVNAMIEIQSNLDDEIERIDKVDMEGMRFCMTRSVDDADNMATYNYSMAVQTTDGILTFLVTDISIGYREKGLIPRTLAIEKMKPFKDKRHKELIEQCAVSISKYINSLSSAIIARGEPTIKHWKEIKAGNIVKGMNQTEVMLVKGKPTSNRPSGSRVKWMYGNDNVVIFTDGEVTNIIQ